MIFGISKDYIYSLSGFIAATLSIVYKQFYSTSQLGELGIMVGVFSILSFSYKIFTETLELRERNNEFIELLGEDYRNAIRLSEEYKSNGYKIFDFDLGNKIEKFIMSDEVNKKILEQDLRIREIGSFVLANRVRKIIPFALNKAFNSNRILYNSNLVRLTDDILLGTNKVRVQKTNYFQGLCTNEMVYHRLKSCLELENGFFDGKSLLVYEGNVLRPLYDSPCSNYLGVSTLAVTKDKRIILLRQSSKAAVNRRMWAPSGSGSVDYKDLKKAKTIQDLVGMAMERELREECGLKNRKIKMKTKVIGFARLLERGGKPDFFGITYVDVNCSEIGKLTWETNEVECLDFENYSDIVEKLKDFINKNKGAVSIQLYITKQILEYFQRQNVDLYKELIES